MITYLQTIKDTKTQRLTSEKWAELTASAQTKHYVTEFRRSGNLDMKQRLPAVNFHGYDPKVLQGLPGSRKQADLVPTGLFMLDVDHIDNPKAVWHLFKQQIGEQFQDVALAHITPSGKGLRIVMKGREGSTIKDDQKWLATLLGVQHDECTKDLSRWSFVPQAKDILFINPKILFSPTPTLPPGGGGVKNDSADVNPYAKAYANKSDSADVNPYAKAYANKSDSANGNPYAKAYANKSQTANENSQSNSIDNLSPTGGGEPEGGYFPQPTAASRTKKSLRRSSSTMAARQKSENATTQSSLLPTISAPSQTPMSIGSYRSFLTSISQTMRSAMLSLGQFSTTLFAELKRFLLSLTGSRTEKSLLQNRHERRKSTALTRKTMKSASKRR